MADDTAWEPSGYYATDCNVRQFMEEYGYDDYDELIPDSEADLARFWGDAAEDVGIVWREPYDEVVDTGEGPAFARWYPGGRLNAVETCLDQWVERAPDRTMYHWENEDGAHDDVSYREMAHRTDRLANALRANGIGEDDVVGITFPMHPNGFVASMACLRIGAAFTQVFPGYGAEAMGHRFDDAGAELVVTADGYRRGGSVNDLSAKVDRALEDAPGVEAVLVYDHLDLDVEFSGVTVHEWSTFIADREARAETTVVDSDHTAFVAYSSGTTGTPKGTIHTHASFLAMGNKEAKYHFDCSPGDTLAWVTDFGWIIVPIWMLAGAPALGISTVLLEGSHTDPTEDRVWRAIEEYGVSTFGISPSGVRGLRQIDDAPRQSHDLSSLRVLGSTGEPWDEAGWQWFSTAVGGGEVPIINASGGTELAGAALSPTPTTRLQPGTLYGPAPGVAANVYDEDGSPADEGYLVIERPIPGMTHSLTDGDARYLAEYWSDFDGVWNQNDWVEIDDGFWFITGRADDTMNVAGRRVTAPEIEEVISAHDAVGETTVVPVPDDVKGQVPVAFVTCPRSQPDPEALEMDVQTLVSEKLGKPFRPERVHVVAALPRTQTGKIPRGVVESVYLGEPAGDVSTLDDPDVLEEFPSRD